MFEVDLDPVALEPYEQLLGPARMAKLRAGVGRLAGRTIWNINSTAAGGGVAELLSSLIPLARALGVDVRWLVVDGDPAFFALTKRLCSTIYGSAGDGGPLGPDERAHYRRVTDDNAAQLQMWVDPGDVVVVHDPQPAGLIRRARELGATVIWRSHIGSDQPNSHTEAGWAFLRPFVMEADATVFLTEGHAQHWTPDTHVIPPSIDPCAPKNMALTARQAVDILGVAGVLGGSASAEITVPAPLGPAITVRHAATVLRVGPPPPPDVPMVVQVSRWDRLKDMDGVLEAFMQAGAGHCHLTLAGPAVDSVADDPEAAGAYELSRSRWAALAPDDRRRVQLLCLPVTDRRENALVVNALQRHATVVVQKSLAEGFGLTAAEAMWKARPIVASAVGGLREQVVDGVTGLAVADPRDLPATAAAVRRLLDDPGFAQKLGAGARQLVVDRFLPDRHLLEWAATLEKILTKGSHDAQTG
ncbi:glycosyltransferase [Actinoplanes sp. N902-109]|uniref:glycosyltransferase n=1 Tax=Actinoplanes sp. (strain N902-109) TaxID=649831 RepID=UPI0003295A9B|nr:glycosyltransferase [Actinoplanes sp. N902-109]AGL16372.1 group 1 glycosyl transferase [Actinoplanes sp. N902-109]